MRINDDWAAKSAAAPNDVFAAASWFESLWNSSSKAVSINELEWQCNTWGSGRGVPAWEDVAPFVLIIKRFDLRSWRNREGRDELAVSVPLCHVESIVKLINDIGEVCDEWPWLIEDDEDLDFSDEAYSAKRIAVAATALGVSRDVIAADDEWIELLRLI